VNRQPRRSLGFWQRGERAQTTTEFVVVFPMLLLLFFLMLEFGWMLKNYIVVTNTVREVARCAAVDRCRYEGTTVTARELAEHRIDDGRAIASSDAGDFKFSIHYVDEDGDTPPVQEKGDSLVVCIESPSGAVTPLRAFAAMAGIIPDPFPLKARAEMRIEAKDGYQGGDLGGPISSGGSACTPVAAP
jgi:hypothetical protein